MKNTTLKMLWLISGILLIFVGVVAMVSPEQTLITVAFVLGLAMLISGVMDLIVFAMAHKMVIGAGWFLADGILTVLISLLLLFNQTVAAGAIPFIFAMWLIFSGVSKTIHSFDLKFLRVKDWGWFALLGIAQAAFGFICFLKPVAGAGIVSILIGVSLILQGAMALLKALFAQRFWRGE